MRYLLADKGYAADRLRRSLGDAGAVAVIPGRSGRKRVICYDKDRYCGRDLIENACRLKDFRRIHTRHDKLAPNFLSSVALATAVAFWLRMTPSPRRILALAPSLGGCEDRDR
jgi:transposase